jgi:hypothetical protein
MQMSCRTILLAPQALRASAFVRTGKGRIAHRHRPRRHSAIQTATLLHAAAAPQKQTFGLLFYPQSRQVLMQIKWPFSRVRQRCAVLKLGELCGRRRDYRLLCLPTRAIRGCEGELARLQGVALQLCRHRGRPCRRDGAGCADGRLSNLVREGRAGPCAGWGHKEVAHRLVFAGNRQPFPLGDACCFNRRVHNAMSHSGPKRRSTEKPGLASLVRCRTERSKSSGQGAPAGRLLALQIRLARAVRHVARGAWGSGLPFNQGVLACPNMSSVSWNFAQAKRSRCDHE